MTDPIDRPQNTAGPGSPPEPPRWSTTQRATMPGPAPAVATSHDAADGPTEPSKDASRRVHPWLLVGVLLVGLVAGLLGGYVGAQLGDEDVERSGSPAQVDVGKVAASALPGVVTIKISDGERSGGGSGFVIREDGYILTNNHVASVAGDGSVQVVFSDGSSVEGKVVGSDASYDLAVVKVERSGLAPLAFGDSDDVHVGDAVVAVGAPLGLESTVTSGIVSALDRPVVAGSSQDQASYINAVQTDAAINPGNSGGPLMDRNGKVVGVNTAIARIPGSTGGSQGNIGLGFAIPAAMAERASRQLIETGKVQHAALGALLDLSYDGEGARVGGGGDEPAVKPGGPADQAGIKDGDVILEVDGRRVRDADMLIVTTRSKAVGESVRLLVRSGDDERTVDVVLADVGD